MNNIYFLVTNSTDKIIDANTSIKEMNEQQKKNTFIVQSPKALINTDGIHLYFFLSGRLNVDSTRYNDIVINEITPTQAAIMQKQYKIKVINIDVINRFNSRYVINADEY